MFAMFAMMEHYSKKTIESPASSPLVVLGDFLFEFIVTMLVVEEEDSSSTINLGKV